MKDELTPLLHQSIPIPIKPQSFLYFILIITFSAIGFFMPSFPIILNKNNFLLFIPFFTNSLTEIEVSMLVVNALLSCLLVSLLLKYWDLRSILIFTYPTSIISNLLIFIFISFFNTNYSTNSSLSLIVSLCCSLCYAARGEKQKLINRVSLFPSELFYLILFWILLCMRWPPLVMISGIISIFVSYAILSYFKPGGETGRNNYFSWRSFLVLPRDERDIFSQSSQITQDSPLLKQEDSKIPSILQSYEIQTDHTLSEADQNRRLRALRAIEERLAMSANP
ncbi:hypothetical protein M9Y10_034486 [Tritrichomonas musculus]|uniref:Rhomboid family protein n=1 Tax=Tritrichomonas musculus TaxID=1915356 RepID=A0ABR2KF48_9EUKA